MVYLGEDTERAVADPAARPARARWPRAGGIPPHRDVMSGSRTYPADEFVADAAAAGLEIDQRFGTYELHPPVDDYAVWILSAAD